MYDVIGDIHGHADALEALLHRLGYARRDGAHRHPGRQALFLGDFIDRGPQIRRALEIVRPMVEAGAALAVMGNHELNALAFHTPDRQRPGEHLRRHNETNSNQHAETMRQLSADDLASHLDWFRTLPLWLDLDSLRVVHACWDDDRMARIAGPIDDDFLHAACAPHGNLFEPVEAVLKGKETRLPPGITYRDKDGHVRKRARVKWYEPPEGHTLGTYLMEHVAIEPDAPLPAEVIDAAVPYPADAKPVFTGHYWLKGPAPTLQRDNVACLDWSVARGGFLCAYRWDGERVLDEAKFVKRP
ncbi:MAG: metallophosphoesterase [Planctomycetaceae bacterium]